MAKHNQKVEYTTETVEQYLARGGRVTQWVKPNQEEVIDTRSWSQRHYDQANKTKYHQQKNQEQKATPENPSITMLSMSG